MSSQQDQREANFASLCKQNYPRLEVADSVFVEALRQHKDEGLAMDAVANWQAWESQATIPDPGPQPKPEAPLDSIERQKREYERFEKANRDRLEREQREKEEQERAKREEEAAEKVKRDQEAAEKAKREQEAEAEWERVKSLKEKLERVRQEIEEEERAKAAEKAKEEKIKAEMREQLRRQIEEEERERIKQELKLEEERRLRAEMEAEAKARETKEKEGEDGEEQNIGDIYEQLADLKDMKVDFVGANAPPRISIYVGKESDLPEADHSKIKDLFMQKGIKEEEIRILDVAADMEIQQFLKSSLKQDKLVFPIVCADGIQPIGSPSEVFKMDDKQIEKILASAPEDPLFCTDGEASSDVSLGALNQVLYAGEYLASGVGSLLMLPVTAITWPFRSAPVDYNAIKSEKDVEFDVIHTNWYWRSQWRVFRFTDEYVARVHPRHKDIRAAHKYDTVSEIQVTDSKNIVLHYCNNQSPDYLHAKEEHVKEMVKIIKSRNPNVVCTKPEEQ